jgi:hypothetical protein
MSGLSPPDEPPQVATLSGVQLFHLTLDLTSHHEEAGSSQRSVGHGLPALSPP